MYLTNDEQTEIAGRQRRRRQHIADYYEKRIAEAEARAAVALAELLAAQEQLREAIRIYHIYCD